MTLTDPAALQPAAPSALAGEILRILQDESGMPALSAESLSNVLHAIGFGAERVPVPEVEAACAGLVAAGHVEQVWRFGVPKFRILPQRPAPPPEAA